MLALVLVLVLVLVLARVLLALALLALVLLALVLAVVLQYLPPILTRRARAIPATHACRRNSNRCLPPPWWVY